MYSRVSELIAIIEDIVQSFITMTRVKGILGKSS